MNNRWQQCPNCAKKIDVSIFVHAQKISCPFCRISLQVNRIGNIAVENQTEVDTSPRYAFETPEPLNENQIKIPGYTIMKKLGEGTMGTVFLADQHSLERLVAIKVMNNQFNQNFELSKRFEREAKALARLSHPNIVTIFDRGETDTLQYFIMEYVDGTTLRQILRHQKKDFSWIMQVFHRIALALDHAHSHQIIHRDLKPENILISEKDNLPLKLKVTDFGLVSMPYTHLGDNLTQKNVSMGTINYMAPEQQQDAASSSYQADIYSLGVIFFEILTQRLPIGQYLPPSHYASFVPLALDQVILKAMAYEPKDRYESVQAMMDDFTLAIRPSV